MTCHVCGAQIADKAIVCYKCGTPTAHEDGSIRAKRGAGPNWPVVLLLAAVAAACGWLVPQAAAGSMARWAAWGGVVVAAAGALLMLRGR